MWKEGRIGAYNKVDRERKQTRKPYGRRVWSLAAHGTLAGEETRSCCLSGSQRSHGLR